MICKWEETKTLAEVMGGFEEAWADYIGDVTGSTTRTPRT